MGYQSAARFAGFPVPLGTTITFKSHPRGVRHDCDRTRKPAWSWCGPNAGIRTDCRPPVIPSLIFWPVAFWPERRHYLTLHFGDASGNRQASLLQLEDETFREVLALLEAHLGRPVEWRVE